MEIYVLDHFNSPVTCVFKLVLAFTSFPKIILID